MLETAPRGTKARLAEHLGLSGDVVSKMLSGVRDITADELRRISDFFGTMPPGFEKVAGESARPIQDEAEILAMLARINGLLEADIDAAFSVINNARLVNTYVQKQSDADDQSPSAIRRRESQSSPQR